MLAGLIVARLWNVIQFWHVYSAEPMLILSLRPSGFVWLPGMIAAVIVAYAWMLRKAMDPIRVAAALSVGGIVAASVLNVSAHLTGGVVGTPSTGPLAVWYYGQQVHPVGIYRAAGFIVVVIMLWLTQRADRPLRTLWLAGFGFSLVHLIFDGWRRRRNWSPFPAAPVAGPGRVGRLRPVAGARAARRRRHRSRRRRAMRRRQTLWTTRRMPRSMAMVAGWAAMTLLIPRAA
ncbi:MAG: prolipoprotein diacylglyceryl transferase [Caldilineaceae bacterium]